MSKIQQRNVDEINVSDNRPSLWKGHIILHPLLLSIHQLEAKNLEVDSTLEL